MMGAAGGPGSLAITTQPECGWDASTTVNWISALSPVSGQGTADLSFRVSPNAGTSARDGMVVVNGEQVRVSQRAACRYELGPSSQDVSANGTTGSVTVSTTGECSWTAESDANWIELTSSPSGKGNGQVSFTVASNRTGARTGAIVVENQRSIIAQAGINSATCDVAIAPASVTISAAGGGGAPITVSAAGNCQWTATSGAAWLSITAGAAGSGDGTVTFYVAANTGAQRAGTLTIGGRAFTVTQAASSSHNPNPSPNPSPDPNPPPSPPPACSYSTSPSRQTVGPEAGSGTINVSTTSTCTWSVSSGASWITVRSGQRGAGDGTVSFTYQRNSKKSDRSGTLTVSGAIAVVEQKGEEEKKHDEDDKKGKDDKQDKDKK
jgi:hypothetical protein